MTRFAAIDPSSTWNGWAVFDDDALVAWGKFNLSKVDYSFRFQAAINDLSQTCERYAVRGLAIEDVSYAWNSKFRNRNIAGLQVVFRSIFEWSKEVGLDFAAYNPATWKNGVVGASHATKGITKENILFRFPRLPRNLTEHEYDAIGIGVYHAGILKLRAMAEGG